MIAQSVAEIISRHVRLTVEGIDRMYLCGGRAARELRLGKPCCDSSTGKTAARATRLWLPIKYRKHPMQSSMAVAGMDALSESLRKHFDTFRANQRHYSIIAQFARRPSPCPTTAHRVVARGHAFSGSCSNPGACAKPSACRPPAHFLPLACKRKSRQGVKT